MFGKSNPTAPIMLNGSITKGVSVTHENLSTSNPIINNNISIKNTNSESGEIEAKGEVHYESPYANVQERSVNEVNITDLQSQLSFLRVILNIYINQKLYFSGKYIVCTPDELIDLIKLLTLCEQVEIETEAIEVSCLGNPKLPYAKIINIWTIKDGQRSIFKYTFPQFLSIFDECKVSLKVVRVQ